MNVIERLKRWLKLDADVKTPGYTLFELLTIGKQAKYAEEYDRALTLFEQAAALAEGLGDTSSQIIATLHRADIFIMTDAIDKATELLNQMYHWAERTNQRTALAYALCALGQIAQAQGDWATARERYEKARRIAQLAHAIGAQGRAEGHLADTYLQEGNAAYAIHLLEEALSGLESSGDIEMVSYFVGRLGEAFIASGKEQEGAQLLTQALMVAQGMPFRLQARQWHLALGDYALRKNHMESAKDHFESALALFKPPYHSLYAHTRLRAAHAAHAIGDTPNALAHIQAALAIAQTLDDPDLLAQCNMWLGLALQADKRPEEALPYLQEAAQSALIADVADRARVLRALAAAQLALGADEAAIQTYESALALVADDLVAAAQTLTGLGHIYRQRADYGPAIQSWSKALEAYQAQNETAYMARLYCDIAEARIASGQRRRAIKDYEQALMLLHKVADKQTRGLVLANAAVAYVDEGDIESAESFFRESIHIAQELGDKMAEALRRNNYGYFLLQIGELQPAAVCLNDALELCRQHALPLLEAVILSNISQVYMARGDAQRAQDYARKALDHANQVGDKRGAASAKTQLAKALLVYSASLEVHALLEEAIRFGRAERDIPLTVSALIGQAQAYQKWNAPEKAKQCIDEAVQIATRAETRRLLADALAVRSQLESDHNDLSRAHATWEEAQKLYRILRAPIKPPMWLAKNQRLAT